MEVITMDAKGLVRIPASLRKELALQPGSQFRLFVSPQQDNLTLVPTGSIKEGLGILPKPKQALSIEEINDAVQKATAEETASHARH
ncbi:MAG: AbrB/MazE/SpoVT family DNA-binding domain-containing protein [Verrucomicrobiota bacterium]